MKGLVTSADGIHIAYETRDEGTPALVFVHGWSCDRTYWDGRLPAFSRQFKVVALDLAGHGESGLGRKTWTMGAFGRDVAAVVEKLGLDRVILIGHYLKLPVVAINPDYQPSDIASLERCGVRVFLMAGVGHFLMIEYPERFNRLLAKEIEEYCHVASKAQ